MSTLRLGTRGSPLALAQAGWVRAELQRQHPSCRVELAVIKTSGDRIQDRSLSEVGGKGLFVKEIEVALLQGDVDLAVHSMKDLPAELAAGLVVVAVPERADPVDVLIARPSSSLIDLPVGARVGTSSLRRAALLRVVRADLDVVPLRGNVDTRLRRLDEGAIDAIVVAAAGLARLGVAPAGMRRLSPETFVPAIGQGALAIEARAGEHEALLARLDHAATHIAVRAERAFLRGASGSCTTPIAAHARVDAGAVAMDAVIASPDGRSVVRGSIRGAVADAERLGEELAADLLGRGGAAILRALGARP